MRRKACRVPDQSCRVRRESRQHDILRDLHSHCVGRAPRGSRQRALDFRNSQAPCPAGKEEESFDSSSLLPFRMSRPRLRNPRSLPGPFPEPNAPVQEMGGPRGRNQPRAGPSRTGVQRRTPFRRMCSVPRYRENRRAHGQESRGLHPCVPST